MKFSSQRPGSFWSAPRIPTSDQVQHRKSAIHGLPVTLQCSESSLTNLISSGLNLLCLQINSKLECRWTWSEVAILGADQKDRGLWGREWTYGCMWHTRMCVVRMHVWHLRRCALLNVSARHDLCTCKNEM